MEILNRREQVAAASLPPEIVDASVVVKKTDYATASKAGVVKIGNNINVSSGKISVPDASNETAGVVKVGANLSVDEDGFLNASAGSSGITVDEIWSGTVTNTSTDIASSMTVPYSDYKLLLFMKSGANITAGQMVPVSGMVVGTAVANNLYIGTDIPIIVKLHDNGFFVNSTDNQAIKIYGIK